MDDSTIEIREETPDDVAAIRAINVDAFNYPSEADLVDALREEGVHIASLVAVEDDKVLGHIFFSPVTIESDKGRLEVAGLAPMAVTPRRQKSGIGSMLVKAGLALMKEKGYPGVVLLGHPEYYPRFGFRPSHEFGVEYSYNVPPESFMALELTEGALSAHPGAAKYHPAFDEM